MRTGKTAKLLIDLKEQLDNGKVILVAGLKAPYDLGEEYEAVRNFREKELTGYTFRKK